MAMTETHEKANRLHRGLIIGFIGQLLGRLVDVQWHLTHSGFESGGQQVQAHWLMWVATLFLIVVAALALRQEMPRNERVGYIVVLVSNVAFIGVGVIHFFQHLDHREVDWSHFLLAVTNIVAAIGVIWVVVARPRAKTVVTQ
jgi:hypothetical protein